MQHAIVSTHIHLVALIDRILTRARTVCAEWSSHTDGAGAARRLRSERAQSTAEYALVLLGAATVALVFIAWAGKTNRIGKLFDSVIDTVIGKV